MQRKIKQATILSPAEIELLFTKGLQFDRDRALFGLCLYTATSIAEACSMLLEDVYALTGEVLKEINIRKKGMKVKLAARTIPVNPELRLLLTIWQPHTGKIYLFPGRHPNHHWKHLHVSSADRVLREAFSRIGIEGASTHSFRRTALTQMSNAGIPLRIVQEISGYSSLSKFQEYLEVSVSQAKENIVPASLPFLRKKTTYYSKGL